MTLSNESYWVNIKRSDLPLHVLETQGYDHIFNSCEYGEDDYVSIFSIEIRGEDRQNLVAVIGSCYACDEHCAALDGSKLTVLMDGEIMRFDLETISLLQHQTVGREIYFSIYPIHDGYLIHGELSILRISKDYERIWDFCGADIWVLQDNDRKAIEIVGDRIHLEDWNGVQYILDMDGNVLWDTYNEWLLQSKGANQTNPE